METGIFARRASITINKIEITMRELTLDDIGELKVALMSIFKKVNIDDMANGKLTLVDIVGVFLSKETVSAVKEVLALLTDRTKAEYNNLSISAFKTLVKLFFEVNPPGEIKELFTMVTDLLPTK